MYKFDTEIAVKDFIAECAKDAGWNNPTYPYLTPIQTTDGWWVVSNHLTEKKGKEKGLKKVELTGDEVLPEVFESFEI